MKKVFVVPVRIWAFMEMLKEFKFRLKENKCAKTLERKSLFIVLYFICRNHRDEVLNWGKRWLVPDTISVTVERRRSPHWRLADVILSFFTFTFRFEPQVAGVIFSFFHFNFSFLSTSMPLYFWLTIVYMFFFRWCTTQWFYNSHCSIYLFMFLPVIFFEPWSIHSSDSQ